MGLSTNPSVDDNAQQPKYSLTNQGGSNGTSDWQFYYPEGIATDPSGNVYVFDSGNDRIQVFSPSPST